ncbi:MAG: alpha/beta hydrolase [Saprospiraceae bacterium]|nr:alpha/beta hydrolase [Saprospiraceae bacterium]
MTAALLLFISIMCGWMVEKSPENAPYVYYIEVESEDSTKYDAIYGGFVLDEEEQLKKEDPMDIGSEEFYAMLAAQLESLPEEKRNVLIFIHGMWAHRDFFQEEQLSRMRKDVLKEGDSPYGMVISLIWHSGVNYHTNVIHANAVGRYLSKSVSKILTLKADQFSVMGHSMGNRVFQGILSELDKEESKEPIFKKMLFIAADLEENIFSSDQPLGDIDRYIGESILYVHNNDRSLGLSRALNENNRLGLNADAETLDDNESIKIIDVSAVKDNDGFGPSLSNHRYFYTSPTVRKDLYFSLHGLDNPLRVTLNDGRRFKLTMPKPAE